MPECRGLIGRKKYRLPCGIVMNIPTVGMIRGDSEDDEALFWQESGLFTRVPSQLMSELDTLGIDFEKITDYELFSLLLAAGKNSGINKRGILFEDFSVWELEPVIIDGKTVFADKSGRAVINETAYSEISDTVFAITGQERPKRLKYANACAKKMRIEQDRKTKLSRTGKAKTAALDGIILRLVCNTNFPYSFETIDSVTVYDLVCGLKQIEKDSRVNELMQSRLVGNDLTKLPRGELSRFVL